MIGMGVYKIRESRDTEYPQGGTVVANIGWVKTAIVNSREIKTGLRLMPDQMLVGISPSKLLGALGMPGNTAYFGFLELCQPKEGETVVVNGAAGAVGSLVGQIAKIKGCKVIGFAGTDEKCDWLTKELGFDKAYNYKTTSVDEALKDGAPNGVDCFFDNVGGVDASIVINNHMNTFGRISGCGAISVYNDKEPKMIPSIQGSMVFKQLRYEGFIVSRWLERWMEGIMQMAQWMREGKIKTEETVVEGFENMPEAFKGLFSGANKVKMVVKA
jgi:prostaglandin reductase 1